MTGLAGRLAHTIVQLVSARQVDDPLLFVVFMSLLFWIISLLAGYTLTRSAGFIAAVAPAGILLAAVQFFDMQLGDRVYVIGLYAFLCLLLLGRLTYLRRTSFWKERHVLASAETGTDLNLAFGLAALLLVILAWTAPASGRPILGVRVAWENLSRPWQSAVKKLDRTVASLKSRQVESLQLYGDTLALGHQAQTDTSPYFRIRGPLYSDAARYYWRVRTYDLYQNGNWSTGTTFDEPFTPDQSPLPLADPEGLSGKFTFTAPDHNLAQLITPPRPVWISRPVRLTFLPASAGRLDPLTFQANPPVMAGEEYVVHANILEPTEAELRAAGQDYPAWVASRYLQLPPDLPPVFASLARQITAGADTPYDQAAAVTDYLRKTITYSPTVGQIPAGEDPLVWFLFDGRKGFCNYYATAEVVLLRSLGIPARLAVGFAQGQFFVPDLYVVRESDSHAWPEVYFPGVGWVEFEPTTSQPPLLRPTGSGASGAAVNPTPQSTSAYNPPIPTGTPMAEAPVRPGGGSSHTSAILLAALIMIAFFVLAGAVFFFLLRAAARMRSSGMRTLQQPFPVLLVAGLQGLSFRVPAWLGRWAAYVRLAPIQRAFSVVYRGLRQLGMPVAPGLTPGEAAAALSARLPQAAAAIQLLLQEFQRSLYSETPGDLTAARQAARRVRLACREAALTRHWKAFGGIFKQERRTGRD
jgi:transglutaminase-like putative cysteine protease